ncbi:glycerate kinase [Arthrobacter crystallopoietes]|uniref:Glycerate kinase n=1 Tax=Crystallibacter crystallopoietes TaxID=37928 RepID=A0A1H1DAA8_9MICC|nr:glycerate kinase [Arthrobacter crystallopoietes]AUI50401.1 glycerate kinase [Arthrobacter crystallopoietes]SDQ73129.1 glycerate kinase [Arthrobacter crystallopoietes]
MKVVIAPDKFKGSLTAPEVAAAVERGLRAVAPDIQVTNVPVADGGEGTLQAAVGAGYTRHLATVAGPTGMPLEAAIAVKGQQAVIEMAAASGLDVLPGGRLQALTATSRGTGELISAALDLGCTSIILGVGGSACTDGGAGLLQGLGAILKDDGGRFLPRGGAALARLAEVDLSGLNPRLAGVSFVLASDVDNPLLGENGAAAVFGPQKGASPEDVTTLDAALAQFVRVLGPELGAGTAAMAHVPGSGAAGGVGFAALAVLEAQRRRGIDVVIELTGLRDKLAGAGLVITGEGSLDTQSLEGKTPIGVATEAAAAGVPVFAVCGRTLLSDTQLESAGLAQTFALTDLESDVSVCMAEAGRLLESIGAEIGLRLLAGDIAGGRKLEAQRGA